MYLQSIKSVNHNAAKSVNRSFLKKSRHIGFGVLIVHSSMIRNHFSCVAWVCSNAFLVVVREMDAEGRAVPSRRARSPATNRFKLKEPL